MGIPIEHRLSPSALRKRHRILNQQSVEDEPVEEEEKLQPESNRVFGINRAALDSVISFYESRRLNRLPARKGRLVLVRSFLPQPVRMPQSVVSKVGSSLFSSSDDSVTHPDLQYVVDLLSSREISWLQVQGENGSGSRRRNIQMTSIGVSMIFAEDGDPETAREWDLGCWPGAQMMKGLDMFHIFLDVLSEAVDIPACHVDTLCINDDLEVYEPVKDGLEMLKDLSAEVHTGYEKNEDYFLHPLTGSKIDIVMDR